MAFDKPTRNRLAAFVAEARRLITDEFTRQFQSLYGIAETSLTPLDQLNHLDDAGLAVAGLLRERIDYLVRTHPEDKAGLKTAVARLAREQAFTVLNRLAAVRMAEKRGLIIESVGSGYQSRGFKVFAQVARSGLGEIYQRYRRYLFCLFDELAVDLGVLFDRRSPQGLLFPGENTLLALLDLLNGPELEPLWQEDETIGWIYQYYNDPAERKKMREESAAPRNSRELAVRNQFFTPRYVVEFLTDNTLGRIWYEMTRGETQLAEQCRYLVRRPTEIFLGPEETAPELPDQEGLSQEELLRQPVYVLHRALKDPRELRMLDPACGSMHFGLYAFDLYEVIYAEAWDQGMASLRADFPERDALLREIPRLIIEHNIHGIDVDPRAVQIAGLSLWLRAQRSWQEQQLPAGQRPRVRRANIVCAEPMPGDKAMLREFIASQFTPEEQPAFTFLLERVFDRMTLAGEAGSLLKIEEEISEAVREAKGLWKKGPQYTPGYLFAEAIPKQPEQLRLDLSGISDEGFWETVEERIYSALKVYAGKVEADAYQRRLFAEDAARGFAFIDICRKRYDAVLTNPPFGESAILTKGYLVDAYPYTKNDLYAAFVERWLLCLTKSGRIGAITSRLGFFNISFRAWRTEILLRRGGPLLFADLGYGVLDNATVETAAYVLQIGLSRQLCCFQLLSEEDKCVDLAASIIKLKKAESFSHTFLVEPESFKNLPGAPFCYWPSQTVQTIFSRLPPFESDKRNVRCGMGTLDDFRFVRCWWEVFAATITHTVAETAKPIAYVPYAKGGSATPFFSPIPLVVRYTDNGKEVKSFVEQKVGSASRKIQSQVFYFRAGLSFGRRVRRLSPACLPKGTIFSDGSNAVFFPFGDEQTLWNYLGLLNTRSVRALFTMCAPVRKMEVGYLQRMPVPEPVADNRLAHLASEGYRISSSVAQTDLTDQFFVAPMPAGHNASSILAVSKKLKSLKHRYLLELNRIERELDFFARKIFGLTENDVTTATPPTAALAEHDIVNTFDEDESEEDNNLKSIVDERVLCVSLFDYAIGSVFGRWDIRYATGKRPVPALPAPFAPLPVCPLGMLQGEDGLPLPPEAGRQLRAAGHYPLDIAWAGILVDDPGHPLDLEHRLREVFTVLWGDRAEAIEQEACEILGVKSLRDYFRKPSGFFADHLKRYSKSRRQAPIYWPLSTAKGSYTLWVYYHRLSDQTLHTALADFVDPKIKDVRAEISLLREANTNRGRMEELLDLEGELLDFRTEIERIIKLPWQPNLNDGVLITAAPLWPLFRLPKWRKDLKACWDKLEKDDYDWAHLAYTIWPKRVEEACKTDRSIAITHGLEHLCQVEPPKPKAKRGRKKKAE